MLKPVKIKAHWSFEKDKTFLDWLQSSFSNLFELNIVANTVNPSSASYIAITDGDQLLLHSDQFEITLHIPEYFSENASFILQLSQQLIQFYQALIVHLDHYPMKVTFFDENGQAIYDNNGFDGNFFSFAQGSEPLEDWIQEKIKTSSNHQLTLTVPSTSFDQILLQDYRGLYDSKGHFYGSFSQVIDLQPLLATYLEESGQALVGWSDTTSGASISNDLFED